MADGLYTFGMSEICEVPQGNATDGIGPEYEFGSSITPKAPIGVLLHWKGNTYRYVRFVEEDDSFDIDKGSVEYWWDLDPANDIFDVTTTVLDAIAAGINMVAGVSRHDIDLVNPVDVAWDDDCDVYYAYGWIQTGGVVYAQTAAGTVAGDGCIYGTDATFGREAAGAFVNQAFAIAMGSQSQTTGMNKVWLQNLQW